jgi:hypothetical protein
LVVRNTFLETQDKNPEKAEALQRQAFSERDATRRKEVSEARAVFSAAEGHVPGDAGEPSATANLPSQSRRRKPRAALGLGVMLEEIEDGNTPQIYSNSSIPSSMNSSHGFPQTPDATRFPQTPDALNSMPVGDGAGYSWGYWPGYWNQMQSTYNQYYYDPTQENFMYPGSVPLTALHEGGEELYNEGSADMASAGSPVGDDAPPMLPLARRPSPVLEEPHVDPSDDDQPAKPKLVIRNTFIEIKDDANNSHVARKARSETNQQRKRELAEMREAFANS